MKKRKPGKPPRVEFGKHVPLEDYYHDGFGNQYSVARLHADTAHLPVFECPLAALDLTGFIWRDENIHGLAWHVSRVMNADLSVPILLDWHGGIADGRHRIIKAIAEGRRTILARRMTWKPEPCRTEGSK